jgi:hypothetical protein
LPVEDLFVRATYLIIAVVCLFGVLAPRSIEGQVAVLPVMVIEDVNGDPVGPVVSSQSLNEVVIRLVDTAVSAPVLVAVKDDDQLAGAMDTTYFSGVSCTGTIYHNPSFTFASVGLAKLTGYAYSIVRLAGEQWLVRSLTSDAGSSATYVSKFVSSSDQCLAESNTVTLRQAAAALNLDAAHPPPYAARPID